VSVDIHTTLNLISEVLINRPAPLREFDQIYMRAGDMLLHVDHICHWFDNRNIVLVGDGDAAGLALIYLCAERQLSCGPRSIHVLDFDERMVGSVNRFAQQRGMADRVEASYYNVRDPLPSAMIGHFDAFHTNPPYGKSNGGKSVEVFLRRGIEACGSDCRGCVVLADDDSLPWTQEVLTSVQQSVVAAGFMISELKPKAHRYHLDDAPDLSSCTMLLKRHQPISGRLLSLPLSADDCANFYGRNLPLTVKRVRDRTAAGRFPSRDHEIEVFDDTPQLWSEPLT
jgi:predicted methyltransferase